MCKICVKAKTEPTKALKLIGDAMKKGADPAHFEKILDELLDTKIPEQDEELDAAWEAAHRPKP